MEKEKTIIELEPTEAALTLDEDWNMQIYILGGLDDDEDTPLNTRYLTMLAILTKDDDFVEDILNKFNELVEPMMEDEDGKS